MSTTKADRICFFSLRATALAAALVLGGATPVWSQPELLQQTQADEDRKSAGCVTCHEGIEPMHVSTQVHLGCIDCHGGNVDVDASGLTRGTDEYAEAQQAAHVAPLHPEAWADPENPERLSSANPVRSYTLLNRESPEYIRFVNPGDLRVADETCGPCHSEYDRNVKKSLMATSAMLWGGAAYNNGIVPLKRYIFGESYSRDGVPQKANTVPPPTEEELARGVLPFVVPLPPWNVIQPTDPLRGFERGGRIDRFNASEVGNPNLGPFLDEPGRPDNKFGTRGLGTDLRVSAGVLNLHKTRLNDPYLWFLGTNEQPGDYRSSGCTACHVVYANDRDPISAGPYAEFGNRGTYHGDDPTIPRGESGHPVRHRLTRGIPTSQCMVCHMHQPNSFVNTYLGYQMWDYETDGELLWPEEQAYDTVDEPTPFFMERAKKLFKSLVHNPEEAATRGKWTDPDFLAEVSALPAKETKFADYHGHGWVFRGVFSRDRAGELLDGDGNIVDANDPDKLRRAVHMMDIHAEKGMHCVDCHFTQDSHGDGKLYGEYPDAIEIRCQDCHGTVRQRATLQTSGPAAQDGGRDLEGGIVGAGFRRFEWNADGTLIQRSTLDPEKWWPVPQVMDSLDPSSADYNEKASLAKTIQRDGVSWGAVPSQADVLAHEDADMACFTCHTSWVTSCFGCHLPQQANWKKYSQHFEGGETRNWTSYNPQVLRHDVFMLAKHSSGKDHVIAPARSSSAVMISTTNANRERVYYQQAPVSAEGYSSQAFNAHFPHTVRTKETRACDDCHVSENGDNNAWMAQVLTLGTNFVNFIGRFAWVGEGEHGIEAVAVSEWDEPQAMIGSDLHRRAYPANYERHADHDFELREAYHHGGKDIRSLQLRGEYLYTANGSGGLRVYDVANTDNKGFSERIVTAPVSPLGQRAYVKTRFAESVALPTNMPIDPDRQANPANQETPMHPLYRYAYVADRYEGLVLVDVEVLGDGDPLNNFLERAVTFNPDGALDGARYVTIAGHYAYVLAAAGLVVVDVDTPLAPRIVGRVGAPDLVEPRAITVQFRYAFATDAEGLKVLDVTALDAPQPVASLAIPEAGDLYVARTYAYVPAGSQGLAIVDVTAPVRPQLVEMYDADGALSDTRSVRVGATYGSVYALVADGDNGLRVLQLLAPESNPRSAGFSPRPQPKLIATYHTHGPALALSKGMDRDRAVDESGHQVSVFGRVGSRPFTREEMERLFLRDGELFTVSNEAPGAPLAFVAPEPRRVGAAQPGEEGDELVPAPPRVQPAAPQRRRRLPGR